MLDAASTATTLTRRVPLCGAYMQICTAPNIHTLRAISKAVDRNCKTSQHFPLDSVFAETCALVDRPTLTFAASLSVV